MKYTAEPAEKVSMFKLAGGTGIVILKIWFEGQLVWALAAFAT